MSKIKEVINSLCRITDHLGFSPLTAEDLRLAKFNKPEAVCKYSFFFHLKKKLLICLIFLI